MRLAAKKNQNEEPSHQSNTPVEGLDLPTQHSTTIDAVEENP